MPPAESRVRDGSGIRCGSERMKEVGEQGLRHEDTAETNDFPRVARLIGSGQPAPCGNLCGQD